MIPVGALCMIVSVKGRSDVHHSAGKTCTVVGPQRMVLFRNGLQLEPAYPIKRADRDGVVLARALLQLTPPSSRMDERYFQPPTPPMVPR